MADQDTTNRQSIVNALLASGFPFQTAIAQVVKTVPGCKEVQEEVPWLDDKGEHFLDLAVSIGDLIVTIECKKTQKEIFTFLQPGTGRSDVNRARCVYLNYVKMHTWEATLFCADWDLKPKSSESAFCVVSTSERGRDQRLLEKDAQLLIRGTDELGRRSLYRRPVDPGNTAFVPVIVTNARLFSAHYEPQSVSLESGQLPANPPPEISPVDWIRFRKPFTAVHTPEVGDRTVFVVSANSLHEFLSALDRITFAPGRSVRLQGYSQPQ